jgi:hypothetical protein
VPPPLPTKILRPFGTVTSIDRIILFGIAAELSLALWAGYRYTPTLLDMWVIFLDISADHCGPSSVGMEVLACLVWIRV